MGYKIHYLSKYRKRGRYAILRKRILPVFLVMLLAGIIHLVYPQISALLFTRLVPDSEEKHSVVQQLIQELEQGTDISQAIGAFCGGIFYGG